MRVLICSPEYDTLTRYLRVWAEQLAKKFRGVHDVIHLKKRRANREKVTDLISSKRKNIDVVLFNGHGATNKVFGQDDKLLIGLDDVELLSGKIVHSLTCGTAKGLGRAAVAAGAKAYVGYKEDFVMLFQEDCISNPLKDKTAMLFLDPAFTTQKALLNGKTPTEATTLARRAYKKSMVRALNSDVYSDKDKCRDFLAWDFINLVSYE